MDDSETLLHFLQEKCGHNANRMQFLPARYRNVNPDMHVEFSYGAKVFTFGMEASLGQSSIMETNKQQNLVKVSHNARNDKKAEFYFSFDGPRWTFFLAEVSPTADRIAWGTKKVPKQMLLLHRSIIPERWWNKNTEKLEAWFETKYLVDMSEDVSAQVEGIMLGFDEEELSMPPLEDLPTIAGRT